MSKTFELLEKRGHIRKYSDKAPPKELIEKALWEAWKTTPSKNNAMAYEVFVYGPESQDMKNKVHEILTGHKTESQLPANKEFCIYHLKNIERQEKQNEFYNTI